MKCTVRTGLAAAAGGTPLAAALAGHAGTAVIVTTAIAAAITAITAILPELFWLAALVLAVRERRHHLGTLGKTAADQKTRRLLLATDPAVQIAQARAAANAPGSAARHPKHKSR